MADVKMTSEATSTRSLLRNRDYVILLTGQIVSTLGTSMSAVTLPLLILVLTGSPAQAGIAGFLETLPFLILSLPAGALVDRWNRKLVMILCDLGRGKAFLAIPVADALGHLSIALIYVAVTVHGILFTFFNLSEVAALPQVVTKEQLPGASSLNQAGETAAFVAGPPLGGLLFQVGRTIPFLADAISYLVSVASLLLIRVRFQQERTAVRRKLAVEIMEGLQWLWGNPLIRFMAFLTGGLNLVFSGLILAVIVLARQQNATPSVIGVMFAISSVGGIVGSLLGPSIQRRFTFGQAIIGLVWLQALVMPLLAVAPNPFLIGVIDAVIFLAGPAYNVVQFSYRLALIPDELQGRVNSSFRLLAFGFQPIGAGVTGFLIEGFGAVTTVLIFSAVMLILALLTNLNRYVRGAPPLEQAQAAA
jgi:MFS family permease